MDEEYLAPTEISFTTPFKQAYRASHGNGNVNDSYEDSQSYRCEDDDDLNFIQNNFQRLALSEKKGRNKRQETLADSSDSVSQLNSTFVMGVAESKENSFQEESPSFLNFGGGQQPPQQPTSVTPGSPQKLQARAVQSSPSCPTAKFNITSYLPPSLTIHDPPPAEGPHKNQSIITPTPQDFPKEGEKLLTLHDLNSSLSGQEQNDLPSELLPECAEEFNTVTDAQKESTVSPEVLFHEEEIRQDSCVQQHQNQEQMTRASLPREEQLNVSVHDIENGDNIIEAQMQRAPSPEASMQDQGREISEAEKLCVSSEISEELNLSDSKPSCPEESNIKIVGPNQNPPPNALLAQEFETPEGFAVDVDLQKLITPPSELSVSAQKEVVVAPEISEDYNIETGITPPNELSTLIRRISFERDSPTSRSKEVTPTQDFRVSSHNDGHEAENENTPPPELDNAPFTRKEETSQITYVETKRMSLPSELNVCSNNELRDLPVQIQVQSRPKSEIFLHKEEIPQDFFIESQRTSQKTPLRDLNASLQNPLEEFHQGSCIQTEIQRSPPRELNVTFEKEEIPQDFFMDSSKQRTPARELNVSYSLPKQETHQDSHIEISEQSKFQNTPHGKVSVPMTMPMPKEEIPQDFFMISPPKQQTPPRERQRQISVPKEIPVEDFYMETQRQITPPQEFNTPLKNPRTPLLVDFNVTPVRDRETVDSSRNHNQNQRTPPQKFSTFAPQQKQSLSPQDIDMETQQQEQQQSTPELYFSAQNQNARTPLLVDLNTSSHRRSQSLKASSWDTRLTEAQERPVQDETPQRKNAAPQSSQRSQVSVKTPSPEPEPVLIGMKTPNPLLKRLQDELLQQEAFFEAQVEGKDEILKQKELELHAIYKKIDAIKAQTDGKTMKKCEIRIGALSNELDSLRASFTKSDSRNKEIIKDRDQTYCDLRNVENAYNDLMGKYLRAKELVGTYADSEIHLISRDEDLLAKVSKSEQKIELLKNQIQEKVETAYQEYDTKLREKRHENENLKVRLMRMEMRVDTLENDLEQKTQENSQLHKLCDEIISGRVSA